MTSSSKIQNAKLVIRAATSQRLVRLLPGLRVKTQIKAGECLTLNFTK